MADFHSKHPDLFCDHWSQLRALKIPDELISGYWGVAQARVADRSEADRFAFGQWYLARMVQMHLAQLDGPRQ